jgi:hypothetical protein
MAKIVGETPKTVRRTVEQMLPGVGWVYRKMGEGWEMGEQGYESEVGVEEDGGREEGNGVRRKDESERGTRKR